VSEWLKEPVSKTGMPFLGIVGSNPTLSAPISLQAAADLQGFLILTLPLSLSFLVSVVCLAGAHLFRPDSALGEVRDRVAGAVPVTASLGCS
jgi:hypothetical protein